MQSSVVITSAGEHCVLDAKRVSTYNVPGSLRTHIDTHTYTRSSTTYICMETLIANLQL